MDEQELRGWFVGQLPDDWFSGAPSVAVDREEIQVVGTLGEPDVGDDAGEETRRAAIESRLQAWREETRAARMRIARAAERRYGRKVSWGARIGETTAMFTTASVPVMTRLRMSERKVLDTLIEAGVARSRSEALAWCVRLVESKQQEWLDELREALTHVEKVRAEGPNPV